MAQTAPTPITVLPTAPSTSAPSTFAALADAFIASLAVLRTETNAISTVNYNNAVDAYNNALLADADATATAADATATAADRVQTGLDRTAASNSASDAAAYAAKLTGTSTTSLTPSLAEKVVTTQAGKDFDATTNVYLVSASDPTIYMYGPVTSYVSTTLTLTPTVIGTASAKADWVISGRAGARGPTGATGPTGSIPSADAGGTVNAITADFSPDLTLTGKLLCAVVCAGANTSTTPTFAPDGLPAHTITMNGGQALVAGSIPGAGFVALLEYNLANTRWELLNPAGASGITAVSAITSSATLTASSAGYQQTRMTAIGQAVTLPDATTMTVGAPKFYIDNSLGGYPVGIRNTSGTLLMGVAAGGTAYVSCESIGTAAGVWSVTGTNLEPGLITIDNTFSSAYTNTVFRPFVALDDNKSIHFLEKSSGFAAVAVDNTTGAVGTPVTVSATASMVPRSAFKVTSTTAIVFYSADTGTLIAVVISLSGATTLAVGTPSSTLTAAGAGAEDFSGAPKIAQLAATLYLVSYATATGAGTTSVAAFQVSSGTTVTLGSAVNIIAAANVIDSTTTYALTATTGLVIYWSGTADPLSINAVVISVTNANPPVCTVGTPASSSFPGSGTGELTQAAQSSCLLSPTKFIMLRSESGAFARVSAGTISGTTVTLGTNQVNVGNSSQINTSLTRYVGSSATRFNPHLFPLSANTAVVWVFTTSGISCCTVVTESGGEATVGAALYRSISFGAAAANGGGIPFPQGTTEFVSLMQTSLASGAVFKLRAVPHKISGTTITVGAELDLPGVSTADNAIATGTARLTSGDYVVTTRLSTSGNVMGATAFPVFRSNGDAINFRGTIAVPNLNATVMPVPTVSSNRIVFLGGTQSTTVDITTYQLRLLNMEIAA